MMITRPGKRAHRDVDVDVDDVNGMMMLVMLLMMCTMGAYKARKSSPTLLFLLALAPLAQQLGLQVLDIDKEVVR